MSIPKVITQASRDLRKNMTPAEVFLWSKVKDTSLWMKVLRQKPIYVFTEDSWQERYIIADFYIPDYKIVIEVDGNIHYIPDVLELDKEKTKLLKQKWIQVLRFTNKEVFQNISLVLSRIKDSTLPFDEGKYPKGDGMFSKEVPEGRSSEGNGMYKKQVQTFLETPSDKQKLVVIYGPTGSWKTEMSIEIAKYLDTEIISTDSRQIFKYMDIGTGKITPEETQWVVHHMIDIVEPNEEFSMWEFVRQSWWIMDRLWWENKIPMLVGWTGLYIDSLIFERNATEVGSDPELRKQLDMLSNQELYEKLEEIDPDYAAELHPNNRPYVERGIEVMKLTGTSKTAFRAPKNLLYDVLFLTPDYWDRTDLYNRINRRVEMMFDDWAEREVRELLEKWYSFDDFGMNSIGYREFRDYTSWDISRKEVVSKIQQNSRNYAKRQLTWFRKYEAFKGLK